MLTLWQALQALFANVSDLFRRVRLGSSTLSSRRDDGSQAITVVGLLADDHDRQLLTEVCDQSQWKVLFAETCVEALTTLDQRRVPVILYDRDLPGREWRDVVALLASTPHHACVILISKVVDDYLWNEVVRTGGYDVLPKPLRESDVLRAVRLAWSYWNSATRTAAVPAKRPWLSSLRK